MAVKTERENVVEVVVVVVVNNSALMCTKHGESFPVVSAY